MEEFEEILKDLYSAKEAIQKNAAIATAQNEKLTKLDARINGTLSSTENLNKQITDNFNAIGGISKRHSAEIENSLKKLVDEAFSHNKRKIEFSVEQTTKTLLYGLGFFLVFSIISFWWIGNQALKEDIKFQREQLDQMQQKIDWIDSKYPDVNKAYIKHKEKQ